MSPRAAAVISSSTPQPCMLTWESRQDDCVWAGSLRVSGGVLGLEDLVEVEKLPVPPVDQVLAPSFNPHLYNKPLEEEKKNKGENEKQIRTGHA